MTYARPDPAHFVYEMNWWRLATCGAQIVGSIQPVVFVGCSKSGLEEGTIHSIGVLPEFRGRGYILDLLFAATRILQDVGVWRIFCDTDSRNYPMVQAFRRAGYMEGETRVVTHRFEAP
jgi:ribosomal protein S18 acetylase RimI-like enzyme